jgi:hypothetical protein
MKYSEVHMHTNNLQLISIQVYTFLLLKLYLALKQPNNISITKFITIHFNI